MSTATHTSTDRIGHSGYTVECVRPDHSNAIDALLRRPMPGPIEWVSKPARLHGESPSPSVVRNDAIAVTRTSDRTVVACASRQVSPMSWNNTSRHIGYLGHLRIHPSVRARRQTLQLAFEHMHALHAPDEASFDITSILNNNRAAQRLLERDLPALPRYRPLGGLSTFVFRPTRHTTDDVVRPAHEDDAPVVAELLTHANPRWSLQTTWTAETVQSLMRSGTMRVFLHSSSCNRSPHACMGLWIRDDTHEFYVERYARWLAALRPLANLASAYSGAPSLPRPNTPIPMGYVFGASTCQSAEELGRLTDAILHDAKRCNLNAVAAAFPVSHPFSSATTTSRRHWRTDSTIYSVTYGDDDVPLADLPPWPELALL